MLTDVNWYYIAAALTAAGIDGETSAKIITDCQVRATVELCGGLIRGLKHTAKQIMEDAERVKSIDMYNEEYDKFYDCTMVYKESIDSIITLLEKEKTACSGLIEKPAANDTL